MEIKKLNRVLMLDHTEITKDQDKEFSIGKMVEDMRVHLSKIKCMASENCLIRKEIIVDSINSKEEEEFFEKKM